jgi:hypothetical protein
MAIKWANSSLQDNGPQGALITPAGTAGRIKQHVIKAYAANDSYATVVGNSVAVVDMAAADLVLSGAASATRVMTTAAKNSVSTTANSGASPDLHLALVDSTSSLVILVTDETSNQVITSGNQVNIPSWTYSVPQPA